IEESKITAFLIKKGSPGKKELSNMFNDLIDLRLVHLIRKQETKKKITGVRFEAYILDMGSYANLIRLSKGIEEIDIFSKYERKGDSPFRAKAIPLELEYFLADIAKTKSPEK
ncbi:hypothetical protein KY317_01980, partial [Candidatus Woesearchaeota archaeon]|nr:hypothetical protein [Candidatus Woesearchaeota archaeon]